VRFSVLALDYDGTIAKDGALDPAVRLAIADVRAHGITVVVVTGRILDELRQFVGDLRFVDAVVAENGAVISFPASGQSALLAAPVPPALIDALRSRGVSIEVGQSVIEADAQSAPAILTEIRRLELPQVLIFNRGRLMVLPSGVNKAMGLREALRYLRLSVHNTIAIGDAENDHDLLESCELGVAVAWGSEALKARADEVLAGAGPGAVAGYIRSLAEQPRIPPDQIGRRHVALGQDRTGQPVSLAVRGRNVLIVGDPKSGKSWVGGLLCEQLILERYSTCVVDPEGDYAGLEALPGVVVLGGSADGPSPRELRVALRYPDVNVVLDLSRMRHAKKWSYIRSLLPALADLRRRTGIPHRILLDEAHYFLHEAGVGQLLDLELAGYTLVTYQPSRLHPDVIAASEATIVTRMTDPREMAAIATSCQMPESCRDVIHRLEVGQAVLLPTAPEAHGASTFLNLAPRLTSHVRHRQKYLDVPVPRDRAFVFSTNAAAVYPLASSLREFVVAVGNRPAGQLDGFLRRGDFSRWVADVFGDNALAADLRAIEDQFRLGRISDVADAIVHAVETRYDLTDADHAQPLH
jgi:hydroxymethylpyrimidine pyrophosphatase-like HAD family hydrolase